MITLQIGGELSVWHCLVRIPLHCVSVRLAASVMITKTTFNLVLSAYSSKRSSLFSSLLIVCDRHVKVQLLTKFKNNCGKLIQSHLRIFTISEPMVDHLEQGCFIFFRCCQSLVWSGLTGARLQPTLLAFRCSRYGEKDIIEQKWMTKEERITVDQTLFDLPWFVICLRVFHNEDIHDFFLGDNLWG